MRTEIEYDVSLVPMLEGMQKAGLIRLVEEADATKGGESSSYKLTADVVAERRKKLHAALKEFRTKGPSHEDWTAHLTQVRSEWE